MKRIIYGVALAVWIIAGRGYADSPVQITEELIVEIGRAQSLDPVIDKIDWQGAFATMDAARKEQMGIKSAEDLKKKEVEAYKEVGGQAKTSVVLALKKADAAHASVLNTMNERLAASLEKQKAEAKDAFSATSYSVGKSDIGKDTAHIELIKQRDGRSTSQTLEYVKVDGNWKLSSGAPFNPKASSRGPGEIGRLLGTSIASPNEALLRIH